MKIRDAVLSAVTKINDIWEWIILRILIVMTSAMVISVFVQVVTRALKVPVIWTSDMATFLFVWLAYLGAAVATRENEHFIVDVFPTKWKSFGFNLALNLLTVVIQLVIGYVMVRYGINYVKSMALRLSYSVGVKMSYIVACVPISGVLILLGTLERLLRIDIVSKKQED